MRWVRETGDIDRLNMLNIYSGVMEGKGRGKRERERERERKRKREREKKREREMCRPAKRGQ